MIAKLRHTPEVINSADRVQWVGGRPVFVGQLDGRRLTSGLALVKSSESKI
jgi:hypothetical protein